jgi:hypothetical protein
MCKRKDNVNLVLGEDIVMNQILNMKERAVVGHFFGQVIYEKTLSDWIS